MKKVAETPFNGFDESASRLFIYAFDEEHEHEEFEEYSNGELCERFNLFDGYGYEVGSGDVFYTYDFNISRLFLIITETKAFNV